MSYLPPQIYEMRMDINMLYNQRNVIQTSGVYVRES